MIALFYGTSQVIVFFKTGSEQSNIILHANEQVSEFYRPKHTWFDQGENEGRPVEELTYEKVSADYLASCYYQNKAFEEGPNEGLEDYFTINTRNHIRELINTYKQSDQHMQSTTIEHHSKINFYSEDGTLLTMEDQVISYTEILQSDQSISYSYDTASFEVMLLLEDNFWRIRHKVRKRNKLNHVKDEIKTKALINIDKESTKLPNQIKGMNYYPQANPWQKMWENFDPVILDEDFKQIHQLGFNTIRIFVQYDHFGKANVYDSELEKLKKLMDIAEKHELKVIVTLFDFFLDYAIAHWTIADRHAEIITTSLATHPALLAWDIKNEPDLDYENHGKREVNRWLDFMIKRLRRYDPQTILTIGWSQIEEAHQFEGSLDLLSFHYYRDALKLKNEIEKLSVEKPLFIGETGKHTFQKWWYPYSQSEEYQYQYYQQLFEILNAKNMHYATWTLYDFTKVPANVAGKWPWQRQPQRAYGLIDKSGNKKKSLQLIKTQNFKSK